MKISSNTKVLILSHGYVDVEKGGGPPQDIRDYLLPKVKRLDYVVHPFPFANYRKSSISTYKNQVLDKKTNSYSVNGPEWIQYLQHFFITIYFLLRNNSVYDVCFALDNLTLISVLIFRKIGRIKRLVYYSIDYTPERFPDRFLNSLYHFADRIACQHSDLNWAVSTHMIEAREKNNVPIKQCSPFIEVPIGFHRKKIRLQPLEKVDRYHLVFVGTLFEKQGLQLAIKTLPSILKKFPKIHLTIIGMGKHEKNLKKLVRKHKLTKVITFKGFIEDHREVETLLTKAGIGLAPYKSESSSITYYADPGKIKLYLGCGLPVITTNVPAISKTLEKKDAGIVIDYKESEFYKAVEQLLANKENYASYRKAAIKLSLRYDVEKILRKAIKKIP